jgi:hypothetical protein
MRQMDGLSRVVIDIHTSNAHTMSSLKGDLTVALRKHYPLCSLWQICKCHQQTGLDGHWVFGEHYLNKECAG